MPESEITRLIRLADEVLAEGIAPDDLIERMEAYSQALEAWLGSGQDLSGREGAYPQLNEKHTLVLSRAESLRDLTSQELKDLKTRGRGIMAYIDTLPKRLSAFRMRKG